MANKKDTSLKEFLSKMDDYAPIVSCLCAPAHKLTPNLTPILFLPRLAHAI